ncbi:MerR family DNA-binding transcriptional regulator [Maricaulis sp.]|uniref:MerR family transcriptional regulator n=1 Tax=Maricaulis sp. TaxID=1486257 RepID=UPI00261160FF|nr:MerR family DNA-binding transcriptional regulator [Maricaulis sp.]
MVKPVPPDAEFSIRELSQEFDITPRTLRFYEQKGMINPTRRGAARVYSAVDRARIELILRGKRVGFALDEIKEMLDLRFIDAGNPTTLHAALERFENRKRVLEQQREDVERALAEIQSGLDWLNARVTENEPSEDVKRRARAFEALAAARLEDWTGLPSS